VVDYALAVESGGGSGLQDQTISLSNHHEGEIDGEYDRTAGRGGAGLLLRAAMVEGLIGVE
jgi:hypothetical protein